LEGVAVSVDVAVGRADSEAKEVAEGDAEVDRKADAERVPARTDTMPPPAVTEAHPEVVESVEAVREGVVVVESLAARVRVARREGEATEVPLDHGAVSVAVPEAEDEGVTFPLAVHVSDSVALPLVVDDPPALWVAELLRL
jgi:hypothetical protein